MSIIVILIIIGLIISIVLVLKSHKKEYSTIMCYSGKNGSGKTFNLTLDARKLYQKSCLMWWLVNKSILRYTKKARKHELYGGKKPLLISNYPIIIKRVKNARKERKIKGKYSLKVSEPLNVNYLINFQSFPTGSIVVLDEFSQFMNQFIKITDKEYTAFIKNLSDNMTLWRHYHGNYSHLLVSSQCTNEINYNIRYKLNSSCCCDRTKHYFGLVHITYYRTIDLTDSTKTIEEMESDNKDMTDKYCTHIAFGKCKYYDNRCFSNRYCVISNDNEVISPLKINTLVKPVLNCDINSIIKTYDLV